MKKLTKLTALACIAAMSASLFAGCEGKKAKTDDGVVTISVGDIPTAENDPTGNKICMERIANFEKNNPNIKIEPDSYVYTADSYLAMVEAGTLPTIYHLPFTQAASTLELENTADVAGAFKSSGIYDMISDTILEKISKNGKIYLIPESCYDSGIVINMGLFKEAGLVNEDGTPKAPTTWDELVETAKIIKEKTGKAGFAMGANGWRFMNIAWSYGADFIEKGEDGKWKSVMDSQEMVDALQFVKDLKWKHNIIQENVLVNDDDLNQLVATGKAAMMFGEPGNASKCAIFGMKLDDVGMIQMPAGPKKHVTLIGGTYSAVRKGASDAEINAVMEWLKQTSTLGTELTDAAKENVNSSIELDLANNNVVGAMTITPWKSSNPLQAYREKINAEKANVNMDYVKLYNDKSGIEFQEEVPVAAGKLYRVLGNIIQEVWTNQNADCAALLKKASADFQKDALDNLKY